MKVEFQNSLAKKDEELEQKIAELEKSKESEFQNCLAKKDEELKGKIAEIEKLKESEIGKGQSRHLISGEIYDMSAHQQALVSYESSLQNREKALDVAFNAIKAHEKVKKGLQTYRDSLRT